MPWLKISDDSLGIFKASKETGYSAYLYLGMLVAILVVSLLPIVKEKAEDKTKKSNSSK